MRSANSRERADALGFVDFKFHHLRGTHATLLLDKGVPVLCRSNLLRPGNSQRIANKSPRIQDATLKTHGESHGP